MSNQPHPHEELQESLEKGHEVRDASIPHVLIYGFGMLVLVLLAGAVLSALVYKNMGWFLHQPPAKPQFQAGQEQLPPPPRLEVQGWRDLRQFRDAEQKQLNSYGWVDKERKTARIPITQAIELIAQRGLPLKPAGLSVSMPPQNNLGMAVRPGNNAGAGRTQKHSPGISKEK